MQTSKPHGMGDQRLGRPCHAMSCHASRSPCHAMPCHAILRALPCRAMPCRAMPCHAMLRHAMPCRTIPSSCHASSCTMPACRSSPSARQCRCALPHGCQMHSPHTRSGAGCPGTRRLRAEGLALGQLASAHIYCSNVLSQNPCMHAAACKGKHRRNCNQPKSLLVMEAPSTMKAAVWRGKRFFCGHDKQGACGACFLSLLWAHRNAVSPGTARLPRQAVAILAATLAGPSGAMPPGCPALVPTCNHFTAVPTFMSTKPGMYWDRKLACGTQEGRQGMLDNGRASCPVRPTICRPDAGMHALFHDMCEPCQPPTME